MTKPTTIKKKKFKKKTEKSSWNEWRKGVNIFLNKYIKTHTQKIGQITLVFLYYFPTKGDNH